MKAYLKYGRLTTFVDTAKIMPTIYLPKPAIVEMATNTPADVTKPTKLQFSYIRSEAIGGEEIAIYEFTGEV